jgi:hypothetical protein
LSWRVHSRYERRLLDMAAGGREALICLTVRRIFCPVPACAKVTFAQQVGGLTSRHARRTAGLTGVLQAVALAPGGRAGARLSGRLAAGVSQMTLIRLIRALSDPAVGQAPRVLGVDEFALRGATVTGPCWSMPGPGARSTSCRNGRLTPSPPGWQAAPERS